MTGKLRRNSQIKESVNKFTLPLLSNEGETSFYGSLQTDQQSLVQRRRASSMHSQTLNHLHLASTSIVDGEYQPVDTDVYVEIKMMLYSAIPLIVTLLLQYSLTISSVFFVGNIGANELAAVSLANLLANISSLGPIQGIASSLSTLCPQSFGRNDYKAVGLHSVRCFLLLSVLYIPIFVFWSWGAYPLLSSIITELEACELAAQYLRRLVLGVPGFIVFEVLKQYLQAQGIFHAPTLILIICAPLNLILSYVLVSQPTYGMGFIGAPTAVVITNTSMAVLLLAYTCFIDGYQCWCGFSTDFFKKWSKMLKLAGPGILMIEAEWLAFEIISLASSRFGTESLAAQSVVTTICVTVYQIPFAISVAGSTRIAWFIGSASHTAATTSTKAVIYIAVAFGITNCTFLSLFSQPIAGLFSKEEAVVKLATKVLLIGAIYQIPDCLACVLGGILRGQGRQYIGGYLNLFSYYVLALPIAYLFGFHYKLELFGLWLGMIAALVFAAACELYFVWNSDWERIIQSSLDDSASSRFDNSSIFTDDTHTLRPIKSISSIIDHNPIGPTISGVPLITELIS